MVKNNSGFPFTIDRRLCKSCGICSAFCPARVFTPGEGNEPRVTDPKKCTQCRLCFYRCPDFAIQLQEVSQ